MYAAAKPRIALTVLVLVLTMGRAVDAAERFSFRNYSIEDGLAQSQVLSILQTRDGYLWIGTYGGGISRFDGRAFRNYGIADGLGSSVVRAIHQRDDGSLWLGTDRGVSVFDGTDFRTLDLGSPWSDAAVGAIAADGRGAVWIGTDRGAVKYGNGVELKLDSATLGAGFVRAIVIDAEGAVWFGTAGGGVVRYSDGAAVRLTSSDGLPSDQVYALAVDPAGTVWIGTHRGLARYTEGALFSIEPRDRSSIRALHVGESGEVWVGRERGGVCGLTATTVRCFDRSNGLASDTVWSLAGDRQGNLWIGTYRGGLDRFSGATFRIVGLPEEQRGLGARFIVGDRQGTTWIGLYGAGIYRRVTGDAEDAFERLDAPRTDHPLAAAVGPDGRLWVGTRDGVTIIDGNRSRRLSTKDGLPNPMVRHVHRDESGTMWVATQNGGLAFHDGRRFKVVREAGSSFGQVTAISDSHRGIWVAAGKRTGRIEAGRFEDLTDYFEIDDVPVYEVLETAESHVWLATYGRGVLRCDQPGPSRASGDRAACTSFGPAEGLAHPNAVSLVLDRDGALWAGTEGGISRIDVAEFERSGHKVIRSYTGIDGFPGGECIHGAVSVHASGDLWFGTLAGPVRYTPGEQLSDSVESTTHVIRVSDDFADEDLSDVFGLGVSSPRSIELPRLAHDRNRLSFEFLGIDLTAPERVRYQYRLLGLDEGWSSPTPRTAATFANLDPGNYEFEVRSSNGLGVWNRVPVRVAFHILRPWWSTGWFRALAAAAVILLIWGAARLRTSSLRRRQRFLERRVDVATRELQVVVERTERLNLELERRVAERTAALSDANQSLRLEMKRTIKLEQELSNVKRLEALGVLAGGIAHDFNNLLTTISGNLSLARLHAESDADLLPMLSNAERALDRSRLLTQQLLTFSKGGAPIKGAVSLEAIIRDTTAFILSGSNVQARVDVAEDLRSVDADEGQISQVLQNLVLNAKQAMPTGGALHIRCGNIDVSPEEAIPLSPGPYIRVAVIDEGPGISQEDLARVFDPYFTTKAEGSGLGLATTYSIVRRHGGHIDARSAAGKGTVFTVYLPASDMRSATPAGKAIPDLALGSGRILVMDDDSLVRATVEVMLRRLGYEPVTVTDGRQAIGAYRLAAETGRPFAAVIMDLTVPNGMGGAEATRVLLADDPRARVIVSSGYSDDPVMSEYRDHGFRAVLPKPYALERLGAVIQDVLMVEEV